MSTLGRILVVDDEPGAAAVLAEYLRLQEYSVDLISTHTEFSELLGHSKSEYDVVVLDDHVGPGPDGRSMLVQLKKLWPDVQVVMISGDGTSEMATKAVSVGAVSYLQKPLSLPEVNARIQAAVSRRSFDQQTDLLLSDPSCERSELKRHVRRMEGLVNMDFKLLNSLEYHQIIDTIVQGAATLMDVGLVAALLVRNTRPTISMWGGYRCTQPCRNSVVEQLLSDWQGFGGAEISGENVELRLLGEADDSCETTKQIASVPLFIQDTFVGFLSAFSLGDRPVDQYSIHILRIVAGRAEAVLEKALLHEHTKILATTDTLTGLSNRRVFREVLNSEFGRAARYGGQVSVIMSDIDHFKAFNDTYGHQVGDFVLHGVAEAFSEQVRAVDTLARYGGEEFILIAPETSGQNALILAEKLRISVESRTFETSDGQMLKVTASLGVASYPADGAESPDELIEQADSGLYAAKEGGRNRINRLVSPRMSDVSKY